MMIVIIIVISKIKIFLLDWINHSILGSGLFSIGYYLHFRVT